MTGRVTVTGGMAITIVPGMDRIITTIHGTMAETVRLLFNRRIRAVSVIEEHFYIIHNKQKIYSYVLSEISRVGKPLWRRLG